MIHALTQGHLLPMVAPAAILCRVGRIDFDEHSASFFRFARELVKELRPRRVTDALGQTMGVNHPIDVEIFDTDHPELIDDLSTLLMGEIVASPFRSFVDTRHHTALSATFFCAFRQPGMLALHPGQRFFFCAKEARVLDLFTCRECGKRLKPNVNTDLFGLIGQTLRLTFYRKGDVPFVGRRTMNGTGLARANDLSMRDHFDGANLREAHPIILRDGKATLRVGHTIITSIALKAGIARFLASLTASEKGFEGQIDTHGHVLQDLRMHVSKGRAFFFQDRIRPLLLKTREKNTISLVGCFAHFQ